MPLLAKLPLPIAAILGSGGRSLHAWVRIDAANADEFRGDVSRMLALLAKFGVDAKNKNPSRMSRLPGVVCGNGHEPGIYSRQEAAKILGNKTTRYVDLLCRRGLLQKLVPKGNSRSIGVTGESMRAFIGGVKIE